MQAIAAVSVAAQEGAESVAPQEAAQVLQVAESVAPDHLSRKSGPVLQVAVLVAAEEAPARGQWAAEVRKSCCRQKCMCRLEGSPAHIVIEGNKNVLRAIYFPYIYHPDAWAHTEPTCNSSQRQHQP